MRGWPMEPPPGYAPHQAYEKACREVYGEEGRTSLHPLDPKVTPFQKLLGFLEAILAMGVFGGHY